MNFGEKLKYYRQLREMSQAELSRATNIPQTTISDLERNKYLPNIDVFVVITKALHVAMQEFLEDENK